MNQISAKVSPRTQEMNPIPAKMPLMNCFQRRRPAHPTTLPKIAVANRDALGGADVAVGTGTMDLGQRTRRDPLSPTSQQTRLKGQRPQDTLNHQGRQNPTGLWAVIVRHETLVHRETIVRETIHRIETNVAIDGRTTPTDRRLRLRLAHFQSLPKAFEATSRTLTIILMSYFRTMWQRKALMVLQVQQHPMAKDDLAGRAVVDVVAGLDQKVAVSERQRTARRNLV